MKLETPKHIWILEDDPGHCLIYREWLGPSYQLTIFEKVKDFVDALKDKKLNRPEILIADLTLSDGCFFDVFAMPNVKDIFQIPFLIVSSADDSVSLTQGFDEGAIDYLVKPFRENELLVKLDRAIAGASTKKEAKKLEKNLDAIKSQLTLTELKMFTVFQENSCEFNLALKNETSVSRKALLDRVWPQVKIAKNVLDVHLYNLRRKIRPHGYDIICVQVGEWALRKQGE